MGGVAYVSLWNLLKCMVASLASTLSNPELSMKIALQYKENKWGKVKLSIRTYQKIEVIEFFFNALQV